MANLVYDPKTRRMKEVTEAKGSGSNPNARDEVGFYIHGELLTTLLTFAKEDGLDIASSKMKRGMAVTAYARAALDTFIADRKAVMAKASGQQGQATTQPEAPAQPEQPTEGDGEQASEGDGEGQQAEPQTPEQPEQATKPLSKRQQRKLAKQNQQSAA